MSSNAASRVRHRTRCLNRYRVLCQKSAEPKRERFRTIRGGHGRGLWPTSAYTDGRTLWPLNTLQLQFLISILAGWVNRGPQDLIAYLQEENRVMREQLGAKRLLFTDVQRRRLAAKARKMGRKGLFEIGTLVTPDTLLRGYRRLIAKKYNGSQARRAGRPKTAAEIERLILRMARDNPRWGYTRIRGALRNLGHEIGRNTIKRILLENGFDPAPLRKKGMTWETFLKAQWGAIAATDFFSVEVLTRTGLIRYFVLSIRSECLDQIIPLGERHLRKAVREYTEHYHVERNHQGRGNALIETPCEEPNMDGAVECHERLVSCLGSSLLIRS